MNGWLGLTDLISLCCMLVWFVYGVCLLLEFVFACLPGVWILGELIAMSGYVVCVLCGVVWFVVRLWVCSSCCLWFIVGVWLLGLSLWLYVAGVGLFVIAFGGSLVVGLF